MEVRGVGVVEPWGRVKFVPDLRINLLSVKQLWREKGWTATFGQTVEIRDRDGALRAKGLLHETGLYYITEEVPQPINEGTANLAQHATPLLLAHYKYGHVHIGALRELKKKGHLEGVSNEELTRGFKCPSCQICKAHKTKSPQPDIRINTTRKLELVHSDVCGPIGIKSIDGARFFVTFIDNFTRVVKVCLMKEKSEVAQKLQAFLKDVAAPEGLRIGTLRTDGAKSSLRTTRPEEGISSSRAGHQRLVTIAIESFSGNETGHQAPGCARCQGCPCGTQAASRGKSRD